MLKHVLVLTLAFSGAAFISGCPANNNTPRVDASRDEGVAKDAKQALNDALDKFDDARLEASYTAEDWKASAKDVKRDFDEWREKKMIVSVDFSESDVSYNDARTEATVKAKMTLKKADGSVEVKDRTYKMKKVDGKWRYTSW